MYKILVVDDEANIRKLIAKYASFEGYQVEEASDGEQAVGLCRYGGFDLVVMDVSFISATCILPGIPAVLLPSLKARISLLTAA